MFNVCECLSVPEQAGAAHSGPTNTYSSLSSSLSLFVSDTSSFFSHGLVIFFPLPPFISSQCCHNRPKSVRDIRVERAPR